MYNIEKRLAKTLRYFAIPKSYVQISVFEKNETYCKLSQPFINRFRQKYAQNTRKTKFLTMNMTIVYFHLNKCSLFSSWKHVLKLLHYLKKYFFFNKIHCYFVLSLSGSPSALQNRWDFTIWIIIQFSTFDNIIFLKHRCNIVNYYLNITA